MLYTLIYLMFFLTWIGRDDFQDPTEEEDSGEYGLLDSQI